MNLNTYNPFSIGTEAFFTRFKELQALPSNILKYPPFNVKKVEENKYVIEMAVAGFGKNNLEVELEDGELRVKGSVQSDTESDNFLYKGIGMRSFVRNFNLSENVTIKNADLINGILKIVLERLTPEKAVTKIEINEKETKNG